MLSRIRHRAHTQSASAGTAADPTPEGGVPPGIDRSDPFVRGYLDAQNSETPSRPRDLAGPAAADWVHGFQACRGALFGSDVPLETSGYRAAGLRAIDNPHTGPSDADTWTPPQLTTSERKAFAEGFRAYWDERAVAVPQQSVKVGQKLRWLQPPHDAGVRAGSLVTISEVHGSEVSVVDDRGKEHRIQLHTAGLIADSETGVRRN